MGTNSMSVSRGAGREIKTGMWHGMVRLCLRCQQLQQPRCSPHPSLDCSASSPVAFNFYFTWESSKRWRKCLAPYTQVGGPGGVLALGLWLVQLWLLFRLGSVPMDRTSLSFILCCSN